MTTSQARSLRRFVCFLGTAALVTVPAILLEPRGPGWQFAGAAAGFVVGALGYALWEALDPFPSEPGDAP